MLKSSIWNPFKVALILAIGLIIGAFLKPSGTSSSFSLEPRKDKIDEIISYIENDYVDEVDADSLLDETLADLLKSLDPHSSYIPASQLKGVKENIQGAFEGIGVEFSIQNDTIMVVSAISGGPSEALGIQSGDRIVSVDGENVAGIGIKNSDVIEKLRGAAGSTVDVEIYRPLLGEVLDFTIKRGKIPIYSVDVSYMLDESTGFIKVNRFSSQTYLEFERALSELKSKGMQNLILDLRGNPGGLLSVCVSMADDFLKKDELILFTEGHSRERTEYRATQRGRFESGELVVLIDEGSASASEIIAGAIQDNDRGLIIGRRSFGKGLVQEPIYMKDGSAIHLTTARYYTPSGRSIQRDYADGADAYYDDVLDRYEQGELFQEDSIQVPDSLTFKTKEGRTVYGGGGIMPDIFIPLDTNFRNNWYYRLYASGVIRDFAFSYADQNRQELKEMGLDKFLNQYSEDKLIAAFEQRLKEERIAALPGEKEQAIERVKVDLKALIARQIWNNIGWYKQHNKVDKVVQEALMQVQKNKGT